MGGRYMAIYKTVDPKFRCRRCGGTWNEGKGGYCPHCGAQHDYSQICKFTEYEITIKYRVTAVDYEEALKHLHRATRAPEWEGAVVIATRINPAVPGWRMTWGSPDAVGKKDEG